MENLILYVENGEISIVSGYDTSEPEVIFISRKKLPELIFRLQECYEDSSDVESFREYQIQ